MFDRCFGCMQPLSMPDEPCPYCGYDKRAAFFNRNHLAPGSVLCGRYVIGRALGLGSFGITYIGWDPEKGERVTIKEFLPSAFAHHRAGDTTVQFYSDEGKALFAKGLKKFGEETAVLRRLGDAETISRILDWVEENGTGYAVMEYLSGETLKARLAKCRTMRYDEAMDILAPVLQTLDTVHQNGLLHRDISPDNIFLCDDGRIKLLDFGSAQFELMQNSESLSLVLKHGYAPPEQYVPHLLAGPWTDVFGAAATLYKMITGIVPQDAMQREKEDRLLPPSALECAIPPQAEKALMRALSLRPENRYATAEAFLSALLPEEEPQPERNPTRRSLFAVLIAAAAILLVLSAVVLIRHHLRRTTAETTDETASDATQDAQTTLAAELPQVIGETYYDGFAPEQMAQVKTADGIPASIPYMIFRKSRKLGLVSSDGQVVHPATCTSIVWDTAQQLFLLDGTTYWDAHNGVSEPSAPPTPPEGVPDFTGCTYQYTDALYCVMASGQRVLQRSSEGSFLVGGPPYGIVSRGTLLVDAVYEKATPLSCGVSALLADGKWTYRNAYGVDLFGKGFDGSIFPDGVPYSFSEGYVPVFDETSRLWGYADTAGKTVVEPRYLSALPPVQGTAWVQTDRGFGTLRLTGEQTQIIGKCGDNVQYLYQPTTGVLQILGYGSMWDFTAENVPWLLYLRQIRTVQFEGSVNYIGANSFSGCTALSSVTLPIDLIAVGPFAFRGCGMLRMMNFPPSLESIGDEAFAGCSELVELQLPQALSSIGMSAFSGCTSLQNLTISAPMAVPSRAFYGCTTLTAVDLSGVTGIGDSAFEGCTALTSVTLPGKASALGKRAFCGCTAIENIRVPLGVTALPAQIFAGCTALKTVVLPDGLRTIEAEAFSGCTSLSGLSLPPTLTHIGARAFYNCRGMQNVLVPDSVKRIDEYAFAGCTGISAFDLKDTVQTLGTHVFDGWTAGQSIRLKNPLLKRWLGTPSGWADGWDSGCYAVIAAG